MLSTDFSTQTYKDVKFQNNKITKTILLRERRATDLLIKFGNSTILTLRHFLWYVIFMNFFSFFLLRNIFVQCTIFFFDFLFLKNSKTRWTDLRWVMRKIYWRCHQSCYIVWNDNLIKKPPMQKVFLNFPLMIFTFTKLHKKWSFPLRISTVNVTKFAENCGFGHIY